MFPSQASTRLNNLFFLISSEAFAARGNYTIGVLGWHGRYPRREKKSSLIGLGHREGCRHSLSIQQPAVLGAEIDLPDVDVALISVCHPLKFLQDFKGVESWKSLASLARYNG